MNRLEFNMIVAKRCELIEKTLINKGKEYANDDEVFHNFKKARGLSFHDTQEKVAWEFMVKHLQSIKDIIELVSDQTQDKESINIYPSEFLVDEKIGDAINYLILIEGMLKERSRWKQK